MDSLIKRLQEAESGSREFEDAIWWPMVCDGQRYRQGPNGREMNVGWGFDDGTDADWRPIGPYNEAPLLTRSLDAIVALITENLPGWGVTIRMELAPYVQTCELCAPDDPNAALTDPRPFRTSGGANTAPLACCIALLTALQSQEPTP